MNGAVKHGAKHTLEVRKDQDFSLQTSIYGIYVFILALGVYYLMSRYMLRLLLLFKKIIYIINVIMTNESLLQSNYKVYVPSMLHMA